MVKEAILMIVLGGLFILGFLGSLQITLEPQRSILNILFIGGVFLVFIGGGLLLSEVIRRNEGGRGR